MLGDTMQAGHKASSTPTRTAATARSVSLPKLGPAGGEAALATMCNGTSKLKQSKAAETRARKELAGAVPSVQASVPGLC